jgi:hypothetical protein
MDRSTGKGTLFPRDSLFASRLDFLTQIDPPTKLMYFSDEARKRRPLGGYAVGASSPHTVFLSTCNLK